jgi:aminopeptidase N
MMPMKKICCPLFLSFIMFSNIYGQMSNVSEGISLQLAEERYKSIHHLRYQLFFDIPAEPSAPIPARVIISLHLKQNIQPLTLDFKVSPEYLKKIIVNNKDVPMVYVAGHLIIDPNDLWTGENTIQIDFIAGNQSLNRNADFLYTLLVPDRASTLFPCFDQPNLKARFTLSLRIPSKWDASANGALVKSNSSGFKKTLYYKETQPISTYLFAFAAGKFHRVSRESKGRKMSMLFRETDSIKVAQNLDKIFDLHVNSILWLEDYTLIPMPFEKLDFVLLPGFQYGGMEHVGNIFYKESALILEESATDNQKLARARLIAHETAHYWFGDLVTMNWFNDVWLKEVFANFMAAKAVNPDFPEINHELSFLLSHHPIAYSEDRSEGSHPIQQPLENLKDAGSLYGGIIYQKAPIVMRQLEKWMGAEVFKKGLQKYLNDYAYANATWDDLIQILDELSPKPLQEWTDIWVKEAGMPQLLTTAQYDQDFHIKDISIQQVHSTPSGMYWPQETEMALFYADTIVKIPVHIDGLQTHLTFSTELKKPLAILPNASAIGYGYFPLDDLSLRTFLSADLPIQDEFLRGAISIALMEELINKKINNSEFVNYLLHSLKKEKESLNRQLLLGQLNTVFWSFLSDEQRSEFTPKIEPLLWKLMNESSAPSTKSAFFSSYRDIALSPESAQTLLDVWSGKTNIRGLPFSEPQQIDLAATLAILLPSNAAGIIDSQYVKILNPDRKKRFQFLKPFLSENISVRDAAFESLYEVENRSVEPWVVDAVRYLNHPLRAKQSTHYITQSLNLLEEIQKTGDIFFPRQFITAVLSGHQSPTAAYYVKKFLQEHPHFPYRLKNKVLMAADFLFTMQGL